MSIYAYLNCHTCRQMLWLGKAMHENHRPLSFHIGPESDPPNWGREQLNQVLWKFLADHTGHHVDVRMEQDMTYEMYGYISIGGDDDGKSLSFDDYLRGWRGLTPGS